MESWSSGYVTEVVYTHGFYQELIPAQLRFAALSKGFRSNTDISDGITYCELGCGQGVTANIIAAANPEIEVYAIDFNPGHAYNAILLAEKAYLRNIHFYDDSFLEFDNRINLPKFNIISLHGIYSWISRENRETIVRFIGNHLKVGGLVYISYNCLPGWAAPSPLRHLMHMYAEKENGHLLEKLDNTLNFLEKLQKQEARFFKSTIGIGARINSFKDKNKNYLAHEYLNRDWQPFYHSDVVSDLSAARLSYLSTTDLIEHVDDVNLTTAQQALIAENTDPVLRETIRDYIVNRQFRKDIFGRGAIALSTHEAREEWLETSFALTLRAQDISMKVRAVLGEVTIHAETCRPLTDAIEAAGGFARLRDLIRDPAVARLGWARLQRILRLLVGNGTLHPCPTGMLDMERRRKSTDSFNKVILAQAIHSDKLTYLASPVTGSAINTGRIFRLFLLAYLEKIQNEVEFTWSILRRQGQKLGKDGNILEKDNDNIAFLQEKHKDFLEKFLPVLQRLGIA